MFENSPFLKVLKNNKNKSGEKRKPLCWWRLGLIESGAGPGRDTCQDHGCSSRTVRRSGHARNTKANPLSKESASTKYSRIALSFLSDSAAGSDVPGGNECHEPAVYKMNYLKPLEGAASEHGFEKEEGGTACCKCVPKFGFFL